MENNGYKKVKLEINSIEELMMLSGVNNVNLNAIESMLGINLTLRGDIIWVENKKNINDVESILNEMLFFIRKGFKINTRDCIYIINTFKKGQLDKLRDFHINKEKIITTAKGNVIFPKTINQEKYVRAIKANDLVFGVGPAGTGKTYLAVLAAVAKFKKKEIKKIILTRPAVEAGESLGFLPGDLKEKVDPYLRPLYDALYEALGKETTEKYIENEIIEIAPLAYMRGRTLDNAYILLDEAQNTTDAQMKMFLTRLGMNAKMIVNGDISQIDLPNNKASGVVRALSILKGIKGIEVVNFESLDVIRHPLVKKIIDRYEKTN